MLSKRLMYGFLIQLFLCTVILANTGNAQRKTIEEVKISLELTEKSLNQFFRFVESKTEFKFTYNNELVDLKQKVTLSENNISLYNILENVSRQTRLNFVQINNNIHVESRLGTERNSSVAIAKVQDVTVTGRVVDANGEPLPGVTIAIPGTTTGTATDMDGFYSLSVPEGSTLVFSFIGFETKRIEIGQQNIINVTLMEDMGSLQEVVVTGYGSQNKKDIIGSVSTVDMESLKEIPTGSAIRALQGQVAGVNIISSGAPGGRSNIFIRGVSSFGNTQPLILVDGVEADLDQISPNDIESMQVLKDAGAAAIFGVRGSNGVIVVTTKKGKSGSPKVSYDAFYGSQVPLRGNVFDMLNSEDFARLSRIAFPTSPLFQNGLPDFTFAGPGVQGTGMIGDPSVDPAKYNFDIANPSNNYIIQEVNKDGTDWFHEVFKPAPMQQHNLTISGATDKANYLFSLGYLNQQGTLIETYEKRYSARINTQFSIGKNIRIGENLYLFNTQNPGFNNLSEGNPISHVYRQMPIIPVYDIAGNFGGMFAGPDLGNAENPVAIQKRTINNRNNTWSAIGNAYLEIDFLKHFMARTSYGGNVTNNYNINFNFNPYNDRQSFTNLNRLAESSSYALYSIWTNTINYNNVIGKHDIAVLVGSESVENNRRSLNGSRFDFFSTDFTYLVLNNGTSNIQNSSSASQDALFSLFARFDYSYDNRYLIGATVRRDGSSRFGSNMRYGVFPSVSLGWRLTEEGFMNDINWLDDFKIRGSYGILGSQNNINPENAFTLFGSGIGNSYYDISGSNNSAQLGFRQVRNGNPNTGWEKNIVSNLGVDVSLLNYKLNLSIEYYRKFIDGLLFPLPLPATAGGAIPPTVNIGNIQNSGMDVTGNYKVQVNNNLNFDIGLNITTYRNEVVNIPDPGFFDTSGSRNGNLVRNQEGHPVSSFFGYDIIGLFSSDEDVLASPTQDGAAPGRFKYRDVNGDGRITPDDRTFIGNPNPDFTYGLNLRLNYKNFDFSTIFFGSQGNEVLNLVKWYTHFFSGFRAGKSNALLNAWTPENPDTNIPKIESSGSFSTSNVPNSYYIEDGSFLKLRSIVLGYRFLPSSLERIGVNSARLYLQASNLFMITNYSGLDPELGGNSSNFGIDRGNYPNNQQSFLLGINVSF